MRFERKISVMFLLIFIVMIFSAGCSNREQNNIFLYDKIPEIEIDEDKIPKVEIDKDRMPTIKADEDKMPTFTNIDNDEKIMKEQKKEIEQMRSLGIKYKELSTIPQMEDPAILVNGQAITKKSIEFAKAQVNIQITKFKNDFQTLFKREVILMVRANMVKQEAIRKGIKPSQDLIDGHLEEQKDFLGTNAAMRGYLEGRGMTEEEYLAEIKESANVTFQRAALRESVMASQADKIQSEAEERDVALSEVETEYWEKYVDKLIMKAKIEILEPEIKKLFGIETE